MRPAYRLPSSIHAVYCSRMGRYADIERQSAQRRIPYLNMIDLDHRVNRMLPHYNIPRHDLNLSLLLQRLRHTAHTYHNMPIILTGVHSYHHTIMTGMLRARHYILTDHISNNDVDIARYIFPNSDIIKSEMELFTIIRMHLSKS